VPVTSPIPTITHHFITRLSPTYRRHSAQTDGYLKEKLVHARVRAKERGDAAAEMADNTLDMMVGRELRGEDWMADDEICQEVFQCEWSEGLRAVYVV
jgi:hypothetical protein